MDNIQVQNIKIKFNVKNGPDQTVTLDVKGDTMREIITKVEDFAKNSVDEIEDIGKFKVQNTEISFGENSFWDLGRIFR